MGWNSAIPTRGASPSLNLDMHRPSNGLFYRTSTIDIGPHQMTRLEDALLAIRSRREATAFLGVLLTPQEVEKHQHRWQSLELRFRGATQRQIRDKLGISVQTASRCAKVVRENSHIIKLLLTRIIHTGRLHARSYDSIIKRQG